MSFSKLLRNLSLRTQLSQTPVVNYEREVERSGSEVNLTHMLRNESGNEGR